MTENAEWESLIRNLVNEGILQSPDVIRAMRLVSRQPFLPDSIRSHYAVDAPLPIGWGQTASAPHDTSIGSTELGRAKHGLNHERSPRT